VLLEASPAVDPPKVSPPAELDGSIGHPGPWRQKRRLFAIFVLVERVCNFCPPAHVEQVL